jgi:hypothetical protein
MIINIDFDATCVSFAYPKVGRDIGSQKVLKELTDQGHNLILFTMRDGKELQDEVNWFKMNDIPLYGINTNPNQKDWTNSPKSHADLIIDDTGLGIPLKKEFPNDKSFIDWEKVEEMLVEMKILS